MTTFAELDLQPKILSALEDMGYQEPTPIQAKSIPVLLQDQDIIAQAQTGTGKTAAFALPVLNKLKLKQRAPQALIITPTRELAIQVAQAFKDYAKYLPKITVSTLYGGADYRTQLRDLKQGAQIVVGTPGRVMDHIERGSLKLDDIACLVLDEADEMLKMGFIDDVEWILGRIPHEHQIALFSATMPSSIKKIAQNYLQNPTQIRIKAEKESVERIEQLYSQVPHRHKVEALNRFLAVEDVDAAIVFVRTKNDSVEVAERLQAQGHSAAALNGDMNQSMRQQAVDKIKRGKLDIIVATDVAARGIDVERVSHVFNYDMPFDTESYIHRIGRTGRAGRSGRTLMFVTPREQGALKRLEREIKQQIKAVNAPSNKEILGLQRKKTITKVQGIVGKSKHLDSYQDMVAELENESGLASKDIAAAFAYLLDQATGIKLSKTDIPQGESRQGRGGRERDRDRKRNGGFKSGKKFGKGKKFAKDRDNNKRGGSKGGSKGGNNSSRGGNGGKRSRPPKFEDMSW